MTHHKASQRVRRLLSLPASVSSAGQCAQPPPTPKAATTAVCGDVEEVSGKLRLHEVVSSGVLAAGATVGSRAWITEREALLLYSRQLLLPARTLTSPSFTIIY